MVDVGRLPRAERLAIAQLSGTAARHAAGAGEGDAVAALHAISGDPTLLAIAAAAYLAEEHDPRAVEALRLLRAAGADEQVLAEHAEQVRARRGQQTWRRGG